MIGERGEPASTAVPELVPELIEAAKELRALGHLSESGAALILRTSRRELVSVRLELRLSLYAGVLLLATGTGILVKERDPRIGPILLLCLLGAGSLASFAFAARRAAPFRWTEARSPHPAFELILLLGILLFGSTLGLAEATFKVLGPAWPFHLLVVSIVALFCAFRFDSTTALSVALTSFASWRGVSTQLEGTFFALIDRGHDLVRLNVLSCAALFLAAGFFCEATDRKAHLQPVWANVGLLLLFGGLLAGVFQGSFTVELALWELALFLFGAAVAVYAYRHAREAYFAEALVAMSLGVIRILFDSFPEGLAFLLMAALCLGMVVLLRSVHHRMKLVVKIPS